MKNLMYKISMATLALGFIIVGVLGYWSLYPYKVLEFKEGNGVITAKTVRGGEHIEMRQNQCKFKAVPASISRQFIDSVIYQVPVSYTNRPTGCFDKPELVYIPKALAPGEYYIRTTISYKVNPIRTITYTVETNKFTVLPK